MESDKHRFGTVVVHPDRGAIGASGSEFRDARFVYDGLVSVFNKRGDMVGFFPSVSSVTFTPNEEA